MRGFTGKPEDLELRGVLYGVSMGVSALCFVLGELLERLGASVRLVHVFSNTASFLFLLAWTSVVISAVIAEDERRERERLRYEEERTRLEREQARLEGEIARLKSEMTRLSR